VLLVPVLATEGDDLDSILCISSSPLHHLSLQQHQHRHHRAGDVQLVDRLSAADGNDDDVDSQRLIGASRDR